MGNIYLALSSRPLCRLLKLFLWDQKQPSQGGRWFGIDVYDDSYKMFQTVRQRALVFDK